MKINVNAFSGVSPRTPPRYLQNGQAQTAVNCPAWNGPLSALRDILPDDGGYFAEDYVDPTYSVTGGGTTLPSPTAQTVYLFGVSAGVRQWFQWPDDVDVVKGFVAGDTTERTYFTRSGNKPQSTDTTMNTGLGPYPEASYDLSMPRPTAALTVAVNGTATPNAVPETRVYTYTWVNSWGDETAPYTADPMPASAFVDVADGQTVDVTLPAPPTGNFNITAKRIYRSVVAADGSVEYLFIAEVSAATIAYNDAVKAEDLGEACPSINWNPVPDNLVGLVGLPGGVLAGFIDGGRDIYFSEPYHPYAWPAAYSQTMKQKIVGLGVVDATLIVLTDGKPIFLQGTHPSNMTPVEADVHQPCVSKRSIVEIMGSVFYASPDGLMRISTTGSELITRDFFSKSQWGEIEPSTIHAYMHDRRYVAFYDSKKYGKGGFVFDVERGVFVFHDIAADCGFSSLELDQLFIIVNNVVHSWDAGNAKTYTWRSKKFTHGREVGYSALRVDTEGTGVTCSVFRDGTQVFSKTVTPGRVYRLPPGRGNDWEFELSGTDEVYQVAIAESPAEIGRG